MFLGSPFLGAPFLGERREAPAAGVTRLVVVKHERIMLVRHEHRILVVLRND